MPDRVLIELEGSSPRFRISKPGKSVFSTNVGDFLVREDMPVYRSFFNGSQAMSAGTSTVNVTVPNVDGPVFVVARSSDGLSMGRQQGVLTHFVGSYFVSLINNTTLNIRNYGDARTVFYSIFGNRIIDGI